MQRIAFAFISSLLYLMSLLPLSVLYLLGDFIFFILFYVFPYRKKVVWSNLSNAFPEKSRNELKKIMKDFYKWFCSFLMEVIKSRTISENRLKKLIQFKNPELFKDFQDKGQSIVIVLGHFGNWELGGARFSIERVMDLYVLYHPLTNPNFNELIYKMRTRLGTKLYPMKEALKGMLQNKEKVTATAFIADQTPPKSTSFWMEFMEQDTPVFLGTAKIAKKLNYPIVYVSINHLKKGAYEIVGETLIEDPANYSVEEITSLHTKRLEMDIRKSPHQWLWTHRRWKHKRN